MAQRIPEKTELYISIARDYYALDDDGNWIYDATTDLVSMHSLSYQRIVQKLNKWGLPARDKLKGKTVAQVREMVEKVIQKKQAQMKGGV